MKTASKTILFIGILLSAIGVASIVYADSLAQRLAGRILLQVEDKGEAWYISPVNKERYYLGTPEACFSVLRSLGLGVTNSNLSQIPKSKDSAVPPSGASQPSESTASRQTQEEESDYVTKSIGDEIQNKTFKFKVNSIEEKSAISGSFGVIAAKEGAKFVVIDMSITNTTNIKYKFWPEKSFMNEEGFVLVDSKSRQYETYGQTIGHIRNYLNQRDLSPSLTEQGYLVYEVPNDSGNMGLITIHADSGIYYVVALNY